MRGGLACAFLRVSLVSYLLDLSVRLFPGQNPGVGSLSLLQGIFPTQGSNPVSHIAGGFFTSGAQGKPNNTGVGSLSLLQGIFPTQGSNPGLPHCRQILYQLSTREAQQSWSGQPFPSPGDLPNPGIEPGSPTMQADSLPAEHKGSPKQRLNEDLPDRK